MKFVLLEDIKENTATFIEFVNKYSNENSKSIKVTSYEDPLEFFDTYNDHNYDFDALFVDINMPHMDGKEVCKRIREHNTNIIIVIVSAFSSYAIDGYLYNVTDFVLKPYNYSSLSRSLDRVVEKLESEMKKDIYIKIGTTIKCLRSKDIFYVEAQGHDMVWHTKEGNIIGTGNLSNLEDELKKYNFSRCSNSFLVNLDQVSTIKNNTIVFNDGQISITRSYKDSFMRDLQTYLGNL